MERMIVIVPARDEAPTIADTLRSLRAARSVLPRRISTTVVVVADGCTDCTAKIATGLLEAASDEVISTPPIGVGAARRVGTSTALLRPPSSGLRKTWIATTDADSIVPISWLRAHLDAAERGVVAVAGTVRLTDDCHPDLAAAFQIAYPDEGREHGHVHGANLGVRADVYTASGGWRDVRSGEDHDLWNRVRHLGPVWRTAALAVATSGRLTGRAPHGFASDLVALGDRTP